MLVVRADSQGETHASFVPRRWRRAIAVADRGYRSTDTPANPPVATATTGNNGTSLRDHIRDMLQQSGFSDIRVMPSSFMIRAKDQNGNPVVMSVSPDSVTEVSALGAADNNGASGAGNNDTRGAANESSNPPEFVTIGQNERLSSNLVGLDVYNSANQNIGQIKDVAMGPGGRTRAYILSVGGFLGMGTRYVAVNPNDVTVSYNGTDQKWHATTNVSATELKAAPEFQYNGRWNASKS